MEDEIKLVHKELAALRLQLTHEYTDHDSAIQKQLGDMAVRLTALEVRGVERKAALTATLSDAKTQRDLTATRVWDMGSKLAGALALLAIIADQLGWLP